MIPRSPHKRLHYRYISACLLEPTLYAQLQPQDQLSMSEPTEASQYVKIDGRHDMTAG
jgi:hypothetical protein